MRSSGEYAQFWRPRTLPIDNRQNSIWYSQGIAAPRLAISRVRRAGSDVLDRERSHAAATYQKRPGRARRLHGDVGAHLNADELETGTAALRHGNACGF